MNRIRIYRIIIFLLAAVVLAETVWIVRNVPDRTAENWDFDTDTEIAGAFEDALEDGRIQVWYQPIVSPDTGETAGAEALSRWKEGEEYISPSVFIAALEESGQVVQLDKHVFETVCALQKQRMDAGEQLFPISVNLSVLSVMQENIVSEYTEILRSYGLPDGCVSVEVTETLDADKETSEAAAQAFHENGFYVEIDDFGAGYAAYANLAAIPYDILKIDKSLIDQIGTERGNTLIDSLTEMAADLHMTVIAEGVETAEQAAYLKEKGSLIQGYYYSRPLPPDEFDLYLHSSHD